MPEDSDEAIVIRVQNGDAEAFGFLVERFEDKLKRYGRKFLSSREDIEDLVQEVFIKAYVNIQSFDTERRFSPWLYRIAHNEFVNALRKRSRAPLGLFDADTILPQLQAAETADGQALSAELSEMLDSSLNELDPKYREPLVLYFYEELSYQDISEVLRIPAATVGVRIKRGKEKLRNVYSKHNV